MSLEQESLDRSYQFGRLLAIYEKIEEESLRDEDRKHRMTYALRYQNAYCMKPADMMMNIHKHVMLAYFPRLKYSRQVQYQNLLGQVMEMLSRVTEPLNERLSETYLMGYYLQRNALYKSTAKHEEDEE